MLVPLSYSASVGQPGQCITCPGSYSYWYPLCSASLGQHGRCTYLTAFMFVLCVSRCTVCTVLVSLVQCFAWSVRAMYLLARVRTCTGTSCAVGQHERCTSLPVSVMYLRARARILVQCFVMGNPSHVRVLVFELSRCNCSATPTDLDSLLVMSHDGFYVRYICAGCLYLTCRGAIVCLPVCTANREGWQPRLIYTMYITHHVYIYIYIHIYILAGIPTHVPATPFCV